MNLQALISEVDSYGYAAAVQGGAAVWLEMIFAKHPTATITVSPNNGTVLITVVAPEVTATVLIGATMPV